MKQSRETLEGESFVAPLQRYKSNQRVRLNVGGNRYEIHWRLLKRLPYTRLGRLYSCKKETDLFRLCDAWDVKKQEFFFDRNYQTFDFILDFYRTGSLHMPAEVCVVAFMKELQYWGIDKYYLEPCCLHRYQRIKEHVYEDIRKEITYLKEQKTIDTINTELKSWRKWLWNTMEQPESSSYATVSLELILKSVLKICLVNVDIFLDFHYRHFIVTIDSDYGNHGTVQSLRTIAGDYRFSLYIVVLY